MYKTIVVGTDGSATADKAVETAAELARAANAHLHIVSAYRLTTGMGAASGAAMADTGTARAIAADAARKVAEKAAANWAQGIDSSVHPVGDSPSMAILDTASSTGADLIVVGSKGMNGARRVLGSVPNSVAHGADCAVLIVKTV